MSIKTTTTEVWRCDWCGREMTVTNGAQSEVWEHIECIAKLVYGPGERFDVCGRDCRSMAVTAWNSAMGGALESFEERRKTQAEVNGQEL